MKKKLKILIPILVGLFFIYLTFKLTSSEERILIWSYIRSAKIEFVLAAMFFGATADIIRGLRWQLLSRSLGYTEGAIHLLVLYMKLRHLLFSQQQWYLEFSLTGYYYSC